MSDKIYNEFLYPGAEYRGKPFWAWNGKLEKEELLRQVHIIKEMGFGGFFMHSRTGLVTEYLSEEWFEMINSCADEAEKLSMEVWLYDEDRWPSGTAGGMVTMEPEYRMKFIYLEVIPAGEFKWKDNTVAAFSCRLDGINYSDCRQICWETCPDAYKDMDVLSFSIVEMEKSSFYNGYTYVDTLNREATEKFLELTHEKYKRYCGERFGKSIKGIFTDEPHRGAMMDGFGLSNRDGIWYAPWTYMLFDRFRGKYGYDPVLHLPELFLKQGGRAVSQIKWHYMELLQEMFLENFARPLNEWCEKNNLILTGHILHEDSLAAQAVMSGSVMRYYEYMGYPGVDVLGEHNYNFWIVKQLLSAARQLGKKWLLSELYGCTGWQMNFESHKAVGDWQALFGINIRCPHLSWYTMEGEAKRDYPASILHQSAWWKEYSYIEDYFSRIGVVMSQGKPCCDVLVINPVESLWCQIHPGWSVGLAARSPDIQELEKKYRSVFHWLMGSHIDFDYGDEEMVGRMYRIEPGDNERPVLKVGEAAYRLVIVGGMTTIRLTTINILNEFLSAGGKVIFAGDPPVYVDALESKMAGIIASKSIHVPFEKDSLVKACRKNIRIDSEVTNGPNGINIDEVFCQVREDSQNKYLLFINTNREKSYKNAVIKIYGHGFVEEWRCSTGERFFIGEADEKGYIEISTDFPQCGEHLYVITPDKNLNILQKACCEEIERIVFNGSFDFKLNEPNICVLDIARYKIGDEDWQNETEILKIDRTIRKRLDLDFRGGEMIQPWFANLYNNNSYETKEQVRLQFDFYVEDVPTCPMELVMERPDKFKIKINDYALDASGAKGGWIDVCFKKLPVPHGCIKSGKNTVELETVFHKGTDLEAIYLSGIFMVRLDGSRKTLLRMKDRLEIGDLVAQGLPFFGGAVTYKLNIERKPKRGERIYITFDKFECACIRITAPGKRTEMIAWQPYEADITEYLEGGSGIEIEIILTRRNTFGPLHQVPLHADVYGPNNFLTEDEKFLESYMLIPSGLLSAPEISVQIY